MQLVLVLVPVLVLVLVKVETLKMLKMLKMLNQLAGQHTSTQSSRKFATMRARAPWSKRQCSS